MENWMVDAQQIVVQYGVKIVAALVVLVVGRWLSGGVRRIVERLMEKGGLDATIVRFTGNLTYIALLAFTVLAALNQLGIQTTSFIALLGAAGLAVGLALQGSLSNFAAGFLMILFRPFKVGDYIEGGGTAGTVDEIQIFTTTLRTPDNKVVIIPNAKLTGDNIVNWSSTGQRRVDMVFGIGYGDDIDKARTVIESIIKADPRVLAEPAPLVAISQLGESSVDFVARPWVKTADYWSVWFDVTEKVKKAFDAEGISIPFPRRDIHVYQHDG